MSEDPIGFMAGDTNIYRYVKNNPIYYSDPSGLETYQCKEPILGGIANHTYHCVDNICDGLGPGEYQSIIGAIIPQKGELNTGPSPSEGGSCESKSKDQCVDECVLAQGVKPKPSYILIAGEECANYSNNVINSCIKKCQK